MQIKKSFLVLTLAMGAFLTACDPDDQTSSSQSNPLRFVEQPVAKKPNGEDGPHRSLQNCEKELEVERMKIVELQKEVEVQRKRADEAEAQVEKVRKELEKAKEMAGDLAKKIGNARSDVAAAREAAKNAKVQAGKKENENWWLKVTLSAVGAFVVVLFGWIFWPRKVTLSTAVDNPVARLRCPRCGWEHDPSDTICKNPNCKTQF